MAKSIVVSFGRFNPPTTGHAALISCVRRLALASKSEALIFPSLSQDAKDNPLPFDIKLRVLRQLWPKGLMHFSDDERVRTPFVALEMLKSLDYTHIWFVVGSDRVEEFRRIVANFRRYTKDKETVYEVVAVPGKRDATAPGVLGMSGSKMRAVARANDFALFRPGVPTKNDAIAQQLFDLVRRYQH